MVGLGGATRLTSRYRSCCGALCVRGVRSSRQILDLSLLSYCSRNRMPMHNEGRSVLTGCHRRGVDWS